MLKNYKKGIFRALGLLFIMLLLAMPALASMKADLELVSSERPYDSDNPVMSKKSSDFKLGKGFVTTTYEISSYPGNGISRCVDWGRVDGQTYIPNFYFKERKTIPESGPIVGQPYKEIATFEVTQSLGDMLFSARLTAPGVCQAPQICQSGKQLPAKQKFTIEFQSTDGKSANGAANSHETAKKWNSQGNTLAKKGNYNDAIKAYTKAIEIDPNYAAPWSNIGACLYDKGKYWDAIDYFNKAIGIDPTFAKAWCGKGRAYKKLGYDDKASKAKAKSKELGFKCSL